MRVDHGTASGTFSLDGETFEVENNIWVVGDDEACFVIDVPHDVDAVLAVVAGRRVAAILCTHAHDDHVRMAPLLRQATQAPIMLHPADTPLWDLTHPGVSWDGDLVDGQELQVGGLTLRVVHTPGHAPGAVCFYAESLGCVFTGDTLFRGGPGATGRSYSNRETLLDSINRGLLSLPDDTVVHTGHGPSTTVGAERATVVDDIEDRLP